MDFGMRGLLENQCPTGRITVLRLKVSMVKVMKRFKQVLREQRRKLSYLLSDFC